MRCGPPAPAWAALLRGTQGGTWVMSVTCSVPPAQCSLQSWGPAGWEHLGTTVGRRRRRGPPHFHTPVFPQGFASLLPYAGASLPAPPHGEVGAAVGGHWAARGHWAGMLPAQSGSDHTMHPASNWGFVWPTSPPVCAGRRKGRKSCVCSPEDGGSRAALDPVPPPLHAWGWGLQ